jgi:NADPH:quinone reductase-like Zn-dependent oxidoreductase
MRLGSLLGGRKTAFFIAKFNRADMETLRQLLESGRIRPAIARRFALDEIAAALTHQGEGHPGGKIAVEVASG